MSDKLQLFQQIYSLYNNVILYVKPTTPELQTAIKTLKGLYNQYDVIKDLAYSTILIGIKNNWNKYNYILSSENINITDIFSIITDQLKDNETAMNNIAKLQPLSSVYLDADFITKIKKIVNNIGKICKVK